MKLFKKKTNKRNRRYGKRGSINGGNFFIILMLTVIIVTVSLSGKSTSEFKDKKLILKEPTKVTYTKDFEQLVKEGKIESVFMNEETPILLFTVKDGTKVKQVKYNTSEGLALKKLTKQSERYLSDERLSDEAILTYRTFNPHTEDFRNLIHANEIQVLTLPVTDKGIIVEAIKSILYLIAYFVLFKLLFFPAKKDSAVSDTDIPDIKFEDIAGNNEAKEEMSFFVDYLKNPDKYVKMGATVPKGILFYGPPGTGKTLMAKALAGEAGVPFFEKSGPDFVDKYVGVGSQRVKSLFKKARSKAPCIVFIDEIDSVGGIRGEGGIKEYDNTLNQLLVELDGFKSSEGVILIAATNRLDSLDPALIRPGRFDRHIAIDLPDKDDRVKLLELYFKDKPLSKDIDLDSLAALIYGYSGASIKAFVNEAAIVATKRNGNEITQEDIDEAYVKMSFGAHPKKVTKNNHDKSKIIAYHEAGHALVTKLWTEDTMNRVTIIGTSNNVGGFTSTTPKEEFLRSRRDLYNEIRVLYGGRIAEYLLFNKDIDKVTVGASNDLERVGRILDVIITQLGMDDSILFKMSTQEINKDEVLEAKKKLSEQLYNETLESLEANKHILDDIASSLLEKESLNVDEFNLIVDKHDIVYTEVMKRQVIDN